MTDREELEIAVKALDSRKAKNITALKVEDLTILANYFIIASATSTTGRSRRWRTRWNTSSARRA